MEMCSPTPPSPEERQAALDKLSAEDVAAETDAAKERVSTLDASCFFICINSALRSMNAVPNFMLPFYRNDSNCKDAFKTSATCPRYPPPDTLHNYRKDTLLNK